ncbi:MAG: Nif3-like dinuclear metal center hexameric protein [Synergistes sp.]|nr:Nif3-like dinuclear metal center hexameric protein [Synergistes sp.]
MKLSCVISKIEERIPKAWAEEWDNFGLMFGDTDAEVTKVAVSLDATPQTVSSAAACGCGLLVTHHPVIFRPFKSLTNDTLAGRTMISAVKSNTAVYAAHTNWDNSPEGVNYSLASLIGLIGIRPLVPAENGSWGVCAVGDLPSPVSPFELTELLHKHWGVSRVFCYAQKTAYIRKIAVGGGACKEFWRDAFASGADTFITADVSYHIKEEAAACGLNLIVCDHGEMERASLPSLKKVIEEATGIECCMLNDSFAPFCCSFCEEYTDRIELYKNRG